MSKKIKLSTFSQDDKNFNLHTDSGMDLLGKSIDRVGVIESITVSSDDKIISGNARQEKMAEKFGADVDPIIVETDGSRPVILKRTDIASGTKEFHEAALLANTVSKKNINLDLSKIEEVAVGEFEIDVEDLGADIEDVSMGYDEEYDESDDEMRIDGSSSPAANVNYLKWNSIKIVVTDKEVEMLDSILKEYIEKYSTKIGFVNKIAECFKV